MPETLATSSAAASPPTGEQLVSGGPPASQRRGESPAAGTEQRFERLALALGLGRRGGRSLSEVGMETCTCGGEEVADAVPVEELGGHDGVPHRANEPVRVEEDGA